MLTRVSVRSPSTLKFSVVGDFTRQLAVAGDEVSSGQRALYKDQFCSRVSLSGPWSVDFEKFTRRFSIELVFCSRRPPLIDTVQTGGRTLSRARCNVSQHRAVRCFVCFYSTCFGFRQRPQASARTFQSPVHVGRVPAGALHANSSRRLHGSRELELCEAGFPD